MSINAESNEGKRDYIEIRKGKIFGFFKNFFIGRWWVLAALVILIIFGVYIRSLPMTDHNGRPGLWDITTNSWTLGPDLDPWLFLRNAKTIIEQGSLPERDYMRNIPLGFDNSIEVPLLSYMIAWTYYALKLIGIDNGVEYAGVIFPVIMFGLTIISFFLFVREIFIRKSEKSILKANLIAIIASLFMIVIPIFLSRTVAGIPEKESAAFFFMFLSFYFILKAWKTEKIRNAAIFGILAGISTGLMGLVWGGVVYVFIPIGVAVLIAFIFDKIELNNFIAYSLWVVISFFILVYFSGIYSLFFMLTSPFFILSYLTLFIMIIHFLFWKNKFSNFLKNYKFQRNILSVIIAVIILLILAFIFLGPSYIIDKGKFIHQVIFKPIQGRWNITVAENQQPYFQQWSQNFGPFVKNIPLVFWLFFIGSIILFRKMLLRLRKKDARILTGFYIFLLFGMVFSRYSGASIFNGTNFTSLAVYYLSALLFIFAIVVYNVRYYRIEDNRFQKIRFEYLLLFSLLILTLFTVRGAIRLIMVLAPMASIFLAFLIVESVDRFFKSKGIAKVILGVFVILILVSSVYSFNVYYQSIKVQSYSFVPSSYNIQWQKAMEWIRLNTKENAVFSHWWDYGYWIQSIGNRATVLDGGNAITYWNYLMGRHVLTGDNQNDALEFLYNHNTTHLLIDSTDIGKYGAFSSIGSNKDFDRYSFIGTFLLNEGQTQETSNRTLLIYTGGIALDEDLVINQNGKEIFLPANSAAVGAVVVPVINTNNVQGFQQPYIIAVYQNQQYNINLRYLYFKNQLNDFGSGIEASAFIFPKVEVQGGGANIKEMGAAFFLSPRLMRGFLSQVYLMNDPFNKFPNFKIVHNEPSLIVNDLRNQGLQLSDFIYLNGVHGPIKIWEVKYTGKEKIKQEYLDIDETKYLDWAL